MHVHLDHPYNSKHLPQMKYHWMSHSCHCWISQADYLLCMLKETQTQIHEPFITPANQNITSKRRIELLYAVRTFGCGSLRGEHIILVGIRTNIFLFNYLLATTQQLWYPGLIFKLCHSTGTALGLLDVSDHDLKNIDEGTLTGAVFLDLSKAFDIIDHSLLKVAYYSFIRGQEVYTINVQI